MSKLRKINKEIQRTEKKRRATVDRVRYYWKKLDALYEEQHKLMEGEYPTDCRPENAL